MPSPHLPEWALKARSRLTRRVTAIAAALVVAGGSVLAVSDSAVDVATPTREVIRAVSPPSLQVQIEQLESAAINLYRSDSVRVNDSAASLLRRLGVADEEAAAFIGGDAQARQALFGRSGRVAHAELTDDQRLQRLAVRWVGGDDGWFKRYVAERRDGRLISHIESARLTASVRLASGEIRQSLYAATDEARVPDSVAGQIADIFSGDIDFHRALRKGDRFSVVYEVLEADGEVVRPGRVLAAEFVNAGRAYRALWHAPDSTAGAGAAIVSGRGDGAYYTFDGQSMRRAYLASPLEFSRVTSGFSMRLHPILKQWRAHLGVDYAAPTGTAVRSVGDGTVEFAGVQGGYGKVVIVKHGNKHSTVYAHLSRVDVQPGQAIRQGQTLGGVGATGWATGPHLHFEFRVNGVHQDPLVIAKQSEPAAPIAEQARPAFDRWAAAMRDQLAVAGILERASAQ